MRHKVATSYLSLISPTFHRLIPCNDDSHTPLLLPSPHLTPVLWSYEAFGRGEDRDVDGTGSLMRSCVHAFVCLLVTSFVSI